MDGDGIPVLITVSNLAEPDQNELLQPIAFYYDRDRDRFSERAGSVLNLSVGRGFGRGPNFGWLADEGDMDQALAVSLGSPWRWLVILYLHDEGQ